MDVAGGEGHHAAGSHGIARIGRQVEQYLVDLRGIHPDAAKIRGKPEGKVMSRAMPCTAVTVPSGANTGVLLISR